MNDVMPGSDGLGFLVILNKSSELWFEAGRRELIFLTWVRPVQFVDCGVRTRVSWVSDLRPDDGRTVSIEKLCVSLSPRVEKPKLKEGNKSFVPEPRELSVLRVFFGFLCVWTYIHFTYPYHSYVTERDIINWYHLIGTRILAVFNRIS